MKYEDFILIFKNWKNNNKNPNRSEARIVYKKTKNDLDNNKEINKDLEWVKFIAEQDAPITYIDTLYKKKTLEERKQETKSEIINVCYTYIKENKHFPSFNDIKRISNIRVSDYYEDEKELFEDIKSIYEDIEEYLLTEDYLSEDDYHNKVLDVLKKYKRFIITTAVSGKNLNYNFYNSIKSYIKKNNAICLIMPSFDALTKNSWNNCVFPTELKEEGFYFIDEDTYLNSNIYLSNINVSAKQINPLTGLAQYTQDASIIVASPKQVLEFVPTLYKENKIPRAMMTTGAITENDYSTTFFMSKRINKIAEYDHVFGAVIVEIENDTMFHFRQIQADETGSFIDLGIKYSPDNKTTKVDNSVLIVGDSHFAEHDELVEKTTLDMIKNLNAKDVVLHDVFSGLSINYHEQKNAIIRAMRANNNELSLEEEIDIVTYHLNKYAENTSGNVVIVHSNHHDFIDKYLAEGMFIKDPINAIYSCDVFKYLVSGNKTPLKFMIKNSKFYNSKLFDKFIWLSNDSSYIKYGYELALHGHKGSNGARGSKMSFRKAFKGCITAHTHTPNIYKNTITVGTTSKLQLVYNVGGLSSWVHNCCILYPNGTYQLLNIIDVNDNKKYCL